LPGGQRAIERAVPARWWTKNTLSTLRSKCLWGRVHPGRRRWVRRIRLVGRTALHLSAERNTHRSGNASLGGQEKRCPPYDRGVCGAGFIPADGGGFGASALRGAASAVPTGYSA